MLAEESRQAERDLYDESWLPAERQDTRLPQEHPINFDHWMLREMHEQPQSLAATLDQYVDATGFRQSAVAPIREWLRGDTELLIAASGSSRHAGLVAQAAIEAESTLRVTVEFASEYGFRDVRAQAQAGVVVISQSGETADTLAALRLAAERGHRTLAITNVPTSTMAREADVSMPVAAGRERAVPATKSFTGQLLVLRLLSLLAAQEGLSEEQVDKQLNDLRALPGVIAAQLQGWPVAAKAAADRFCDASSFLFLGRGIHFPIASEGALKLKESAYIHAEGYPAGELKHGPNALVSESAPLVFVATYDPTDASSVTRHEKDLLLLHDMREQGAGIIALGNTGDTAVAELADVFLPVDPVSETLLPICEVVPLQFLAYYFAIGKGIDVDRPRNLVKAVVVE